MEYTSLLLLSFVRLFLSRTFVRLFVLKRAEEEERKKSPESTKVCVCVCFVSQRFLDPQSFAILTVSGRRQAGISGDVPSSIHVTSRTMDEKVREGMKRFSM